MKNCPVDTHLRILIVDDEPAVAEIIRRLLAVDGLETRIVHSADEALQTIARFEPDVLLCDINMPGLSGIELARYLSHILPNTRIVWISGQSGPEILESPAAQGLSAKMLTKPVSRKQLLEAIGVAPVRA